MLYGTPSAFNGWTLVCGSFGDRFLKDVRPTLAGWPPALVAKGVLGGAPSVASQRICHWYVSGGLKGPSHNQTPCLDDAIVGVYKKRVNEIFAI